MSARLDIAAERQRQIEVEGWTPEHDDQHERGHMLRAAVHYLWHETDKAAPMEANGAPLSWPWDPAWFKPKDRRSNLVRAGALCLAEKDSIRRDHARHVAMRQSIIDQGRTVRGPVMSHPYVGHVDHKLDIIVAEIERLDAKAVGTSEPASSGSTSAPQGNSGITTESSSGRDQP